MNDAIEGNKFISEEKNNAIVRSVRVRSIFCGDYEEIEDYLKFACDQPPCFFIG